MALPIFNFWSFGVSLILRLMTLASDSRKLRVVGLDWMNDNE